MPTAKEIKELRERTGVGILDCRKALQETKSMEEAIQWLKEKGIAKGAAKSERDASEGVVVIYQQNDNLTMLEVNCETDFVARNKSFIETAEKLAKLMQEKKLEKPNDNVIEILNQETFRIGEKIALNKVKHIKINPEKIAVGKYIHSDNKKGAVVLVEKPIMEEVVDNIAMHIVAMNPLFINKDEVTHDFIENERKALIEQLKSDGKPAKIIETIVTGKMRRIYSETVLEEQEYALAERKGQAIKDLTKGNKIVEMHRFEVGIKD